MEVKMTLMRVEVEMVGTMCFDSELESGRMVFGVGSSSSGCELRALVRGVIYIYSLAQWR